MTPAAFAMGRSTRIAAGPSDRGALRSQRLAGHAGQNKDARDRQRACKFADPLKIVAVSIKMPWIRQRTVARVVPEQPVKIGHPHSRSCEFVRSVIGLVKNELPVQRGAVKQADVNVRESQSSSDGPAFGQGAGSKRPRGDGKLHRIVCRKPCWNSLGQRLRTVASYCNPSPRRRID